MFIDTRGPVVANTINIDGTRVAQDVAFTLPSIARVTADFRAAGTLMLPIEGLYEAMELIITKTGLDRGYALMAFVGSKTIEVRWVQTVLRADGTSGPEACKAFCRCFNTNTPGLGGEPGSPSSGDFTYQVTRYQLFAGGEEYLLIDRLAPEGNHIFGTPVYQEIASML